MKVIVCMTEKLDIEKFEEIEEFRNVEIKLLSLFVEM